MFNNILSREIIYKLFTYFLSSFDNNPSVGFTKENKYLNFTINWEFLMLKHKLYSVCILHFYNACLHLEILQEKVKFVLT